MSKRSSGIKTFLPPPAGFHPLRNTPEELTRYGFPPRPNPWDSPEASAKYVKAFRDYDKFTRVSPEFKAMERRRGPNQRTEKRSEGNVNATSSNWSASVLFIGNGDQFNGISGDWVVPNAYQSPATSNTEYSSAWLGIDGDGSGDVMQAGTETDSDGNCYAWFEWFPEFSYGIQNFQVNKGDYVWLYLSATDSTTCSLFMENLSNLTYTNFSFTAPSGTTLVGNCAEAVVERPGINGGLAELPRYGEVTFDDTVAYTVNGNSYPIGQGNLLSMVADDGTTVISTPTFEADPYVVRFRYTGP